MSIVVQLERFEGPLGLLLHLIREQEMDVFNINVNQITRQYLEYIKAMRRLDLEVAGEFVAMAATLIHLKSRMLLPQYNEEGEEVSEDPRRELVQKLVEYKKFQEVSGELYKRPLLGRDVLTRGEREKVEPVAESDIVLADNPLFSLISAYRFAVKSMKKGVHKVSSELQSIASRILEMKDFLVIGKRVIFRELLDPKADAKGNHVLVTFLSLLELAKMGFVAVFQNEPLSDIHIEAKRAVDGDVVSNVEDYNSVNAAMVADEILSEAQLTLEEPKADDEAEGEEPSIGREAFTDAASDADIEAEEKRLFAEEGIHLVEFNPVESVDPSERTDETPAPHHVADLHIAEESAAELSVQESETPSETTAEYNAPETIEAVTEANAEAIVASDVDLQKKNVDSALAAALSAFDAFDESADEDEEKDRPPEVES